MPISSLSELKAGMLIEFTKAYSTCIYKRRESSEHPKPAYVGLRCVLSKTPRKECGGHWSIFSNDLDNGYDHEDPNWQLEDISDVHQAINIIEQTVAEGSVFLFIQKEVDIVIPS